MRTNVTVAAIEEELTRRREEIAESDVGPSLRTSSMTVLAWVPEAWEREAQQTLSGLAERHPSRGVLLVPRPDETRDELDAEIDVRCFRTRALAREVCGEVVVVHLNGTKVRAAASVAAPLLIADLPVFLRWRGDLPFGEPVLDELVEISDRLVVDSREWADPPSSFLGLVEFLDRLAVSDISWSRIEPWRRAIAALWPTVARASSLRVAGPEAEALLLVRWLRTRLGNLIDLVHVPTAEIELVEVDGRQLELARPDLRSESDLLSAQLDSFGRDSIYEEALCSFLPARI